MINDLVEKILWILPETNSSNNVFATRRSPPEHITYKDTILRKLQSQFVLKLNHLFERELFSKLDTIVTLTTIVPAHYWAAEDLRDVTFCDRSAFGLHVVIVLEFLIISLARYMLTRVTIVGVY